MNNLIIPDNRKKVFELLLNLTQDEKKNLIREIENAPSGLLNDSLTDFLKDKLRFEYSEIHDIIDLIFELYNVKEYSNVDVLKLSEDIIDVLKSEDFVSSSSDLTGLQDLLYSLLTTKSSIGVTHRATKLTFDYENVLTDLRIISDLRPVFKSDTSEEIESSLIVHSLKIVYNQNGNGERNIIKYFAMDNEDLKKLKEAIIRAENKSEVIKKTFNNLQILSFSK